MSLKKEDHYIIIKRSDIKSYQATYGFNIENELYRICELVENHRKKHSKKPLECVVVESDWSIYNDVWKMVEAIANHQQTQLEQLTKERDELVSALCDVDPYLIDCEGDVFKAFSKARDAGCCTEDCLHDALHEYGKVLLAKLNQ